MLSFTSTLSYENNALKNEQLHLYIDLFTQLNSCNSIEILNSNVKQCNSETLSDGISRPYHQQDESAEWKVSHIRK